MNIKNIYRPALLSFSAALFGCVSSYDGEITIDPKLADALYFSQCATNQAGVECVAKNKLSNRISLYPFVKFRCYDSAGLKLWEHTGTEDLDANGTVKATVCVTNAKVASIVVTRNR